MKMADMKLPKAPKEKEGMGMMISKHMEDEQYPYGLRINLDENQIKKLPHIMEYKPDTEIKIVATGKVTRSESVDTTGGKQNRSVSIQIINLGCESKDEDVSDKEWSDRKRGKSEY